MTDSNFEAVAHRIFPDGKLLDCWSVEGGVSAQVAALEIALPDGATHKLIVRQHGGGIVMRNPQIATDEFRLLKTLQSTSIPIPTPYMADDSRAILDAPYVVVEYVEGKTNFNPSNISDFLHQYANTLAQIHQIGDVLEELPFLPRRNDLYSENFSSISNHYHENEKKIREILERHCPLRQKNPSTLLHGDFWPGNLLWRDGQVVAVIDWEDAAIGDPLADVANARFELLWAFGVEGMEEFTNLYQSQNYIDFSNLPYWDLWAALAKPTDQFADWAEGWPAFGRSDVTAQTLHEGYEWFVENAIRRISG